MLNWHLAARLQDLAVLRSAETPGTSGLTSDGKAA